MNTYSVTIKEINNPYPVHTSITTDEDFGYVKEFFGLESDDVEWYTIQKQNERVRND